MAMNVEFGYKADSEDPRDHLYAGTYDPKKVLPPKVDFRDRLPPAFNQELIRSCTANALAICFYMAQPAFVPSRLFIYYNARNALKEVKIEDNGASFRDGIKGLMLFGAPIEMSYPYKTSLVNQKPDWTIYNEAVKYKPTKYLRVVTLNDALHCLAEGFPFTAGLLLTEEFFSIPVENTGAVNYPKKGDKGIRKHGVVVIGYDMVKRLFICRNSWGTWFGDEGHFTVPFEYLTDVNWCLDMWTLR